MRMKGSNILRLVAPVLAGMILSAVLWECHASPGTNDYGFYSYVVDQSGNKCAGVMVYIRVYEFDANGNQVALYDLANPITTEMVPLKGYYSWVITPTKSTTVRVVSKTDGVANPGNWQVISQGGPTNNGTAGSTVQMTPYMVVAPVVAAPTK